MGVSACLIQPKQSIGVCPPKRLTLPTYLLPSRSPQPPEDTPYVGGAFHVKLVLSQDFPSSPPRGFFLTRIYHPNVSTSGDICVNTLKKDWTPTVTLAHVLQVRCFVMFWQQVFVCL